MFAMLGAAVLAFSLSLDAFAAAFAFGLKRIYVPLKSTFIINVICTLITGAAFLLGALFSGLIPVEIAKWLSFAVLAAMGVAKLKSKDTNADLNGDSVISSKEAALLAASLSLDGFAIGFGAALLGFNGILVTAFSFVTNGCAIWLGGLLGNKAAQKLPFNVGWTAGVILIALAFKRLVF